MRGFILFKVTAHVLAIHDLAIKFPTKNAEFYMQLKKEPLGGRELRIILFG